MSVLEVNITTVTKPMGDKPRIHHFGLYLLGNNKDSYWTDRMCPKLVIHLEEVEVGLSKKLRDAVKPLHLANSDGSPMYTIENGWYYCQIAKGTAKYHTIEEGDKEKWTKVVAKHLRIPLALAETIVNEFNKERFISFVDSQRERWNNESIEVQNLIKQYQYLSE
jgi:hypothetical protein